MAKGRIYSKTLKEDLEQRDVSKDARLSLMDLHLFADDEGYITIKKGMSEADLNEKIQKELLDAGLIKIQKNIIKILDWKKYQKISPSKFTESNLKSYWDNKEERDNAMPTGYQEYLEAKKERDAEKMLHKTAT